MVAVLPGSLRSSTPSVVARAALLVLALLWAALPASAQRAPSTVELLPQSGPIGTTVTVTGGGCADTDFWPGGWDGALAFYNNPDGNFSGAHQVPFHVDAGGTFRFTFAVPREGSTRDGTVLSPLPPGEYFVEISCETPDALSTSFTVTEGAPPTEPVPDPPGTTRLAGADRYATAAAIVQHAFPDSPVPVVLIAAGESFADALAGGPAADVLGGPVLPVARAGIPAPIRSELSRLDPARIVILGGPGAVSDAIATELSSYTSGTVTRMAGANRYATAAQVALQTFAGPVPQALIATGTGFADALAGGAVGARTDSPVLLVDPLRLPAETAQALRALQPRDLAVLGGPSAVSDAVLDHLREFTTGGVTRLAGTSRYGTAAGIVQVFWPSTAQVVYLATGRNFPDALSGVPAAGRDGAPLLLVEPACMPTETRRQMDRLEPSTVVVLGGSATVSGAAAGGTVCGTAQAAAAQPQ